MSSCARMYTNMIDKDMSGLHWEKTLKSFSHQNIPKPHPLSQGIQDADSRHLKQQLPFLDKASCMTLAPNRLGKLPGRPRGTGLLKRVEHVKGVPQHGD